MDNTVEQAFVRNKIYQQYKSVGHLTETMKEKLIAVGIDPYKQVVEFSNKIAQEGATN